MIGAEAEIDRAQLLKAAQQQAGGSEQHQRHREFCDHQCRAQARMAAAGSAGASTFFQRFVHVGARGGKGRNQPAQTGR